MTFAKQPTQPPPFDAGAFGAHAGMTPADIKNWQSWKRWVGGELESDGTGLRDVVAANAVGLNAVKADTDGLQDKITALAARLTAVEGRPQTPFPGCWTTWGWRVIGDWTPSSVIGRIKARPEGFKWVVVQQEDTPVGIRPEIIGECHRLGMLCGVWEASVDFGTPAHAADGFDFYIGQVEGPSQYARLTASLAAFRAAHPDMPAACVTNTGGFENEPGITGAQKARPLIDAGFACIAEAHVKEEGGDRTEARLDYIERVLQWPAPQPMAGLGMGATLSDYPTLQNHPGWSVFAAEELI